MRLPQDSRCRRKLPGFQLQPDIDQTLLASITKQIRRRRATFKYRIVFPSQAARPRYHDNLVAVFNGAHKVRPLAPGRDRRLPSSTSDIRRRVPSVVSAGSAPASKKPQATISWFGSGRRSCLKCLTMIDRDVVSPRNMAVEEQAVQGRFARQFNSPLLHQFAPQRIAKRFADFDAAARQVPAGDITVLDQKHPAVAVQHHGTNPKRHAAGEPPIEMKNPPQHRLERSVAGLCRFIAAEIPDIPDIVLILASRQPACQYIPRSSQRYHEMIAQRLPLASSPTGCGVMAAFTLAHLSDPHLPPLPSPRLSRSRRQTRARLSQLDAQPPQISTSATCSIRWCRTCKRKTPDHIAITGDLVNLALECRICAVANMAGERRHAGSRHRDPRQSRRLCPRHPASLLPKHGELS